MSKLVGETAPSYVTCQTCQFKRPAHLPPSKQFETMQNQTRLRAMLCYAIGLLL